MDAPLMEVVKQSALFRDVNPNLLPRILSTSVKRRVEEDGYFFMQGDPATHVYVLLEGRVKLLRLSPNGQQVAMRIITPGQTFAVIALLNPESGYPVTAQALENSAALAWGTQDLRDLAAVDSSITYNTMKLMHSHIIELQERNQALVTVRVEQRIATMLLKLATQTGKKVEEGVLIDFPLSRQDLAEMTGTTLFTVSRTLREWERQGLLKIGRERVIICNPHGLVSIADALL